MGCIYNIPPIRSKDKPYFDVLSESVNNPIRLMLGWYATGITILPPVSLLLAYWMVGAFFMAIKRLAEYRMINSPTVSAAYRQSFAYYNEERLLQSIIYYATAFGLFFRHFPYPLSHGTHPFHTSDCRLHDLVYPSGFS